MKKVAIIGTADQLLLKHCLENDVDVIICNNVKDIEIMKNVSPLDSLSIGTLPYIASKKDFRTPSKQTHKIAYKYHK